jgi:hypothetical protein
MEHPHDNRTATTQHPVDHNPQTLYDWIDWGKRLVLGIYDYTSIEEITEEYIIPLKNKYNLISIPINQTITKTDLIIINNTIEYSWTEAVDEGIILNFVYAWNRISPQTCEITDVIKPGNGYWIWAYYNCNITINGISADVEDITELQTNWNIVGLPFNTTLSKNDLVIYHNGTSYNWSEATTGPEPFILGFIYEWNPVSQGYLLSDVLQPGKGYWMYAYDNVTLCRLIT